MTETVTATTPIQLCKDENPYAPHIYNGSYVEQGKPGFLVELISTTAARMNLKVEYTRLPWKRCMTQVKANQYDGLFAIIKTPERQTWAEFPRQQEVMLWPAQYLVFTGNNSTVQWNGENFSGLTHGISAPLGFVVTDKLRALDALPEYHISLKKGLLMTARNRLNGYVVEEQIGWTTARIMGLEQQLRTLTPVFYTSEWHLAFSKDFYRDNTELAQELWHELNIERQNTDSPLLRKYQLH
ncbi:MAG: transporter substrate-binding domain-containing protein [Pseudomonadota bacterium]|nr:transporter substrate-binding domain-containing protein [Pseudomonadota bacterium]